VKCARNPGVSRGSVAVGLGAVKVVVVVITGGMMQVVTAYGTVVVDVFGAGNTRFAFVAAAAAAVGAGTVAVEVAGLFTGIGQNEG